MTACCETDVTVFGHTSRDCPDTMVPVRDMTRQPPAWQTDPPRPEHVTPIDPLIELMHAAEQLRRARIYLGLDQPAVHHIPPPGRSLTPCCARPLQMLDGRITAEPGNVTCAKAR